MINLRLRRNQKFLLAGLLVFFIIYSVLWTFSIESDLNVSLLLAIARWFGVITLPLFAINMIIAGRYQFIDRLFGFELLYVIHRYAGRTAFTTAVLHGGLMYVAYFFRSQQEFDELLTSFEPGYVLGRAALILLILLLVISLYSKLKYEYKQLAHKLLGLVLILGVMHSATVIDRGIPESPWAGLYSLLFFTLTLTALFSYLFRNVLRRMFVPRALYNISSVKNVASGVWELTMTQAGKKQITARPGQFVYLNIQQKGLRNKLHPFSLSSIGEDSLTVSIKEIGDFTREISEELAGVEVYVEGAYGSFSHENGTENQVWIAGGIGITPFMSMLTAVGDSPQVKLYYSASSEEEMPHKEQLKKQEREKSNFSVEFILTDKQDRLTAEQILAEIDKHSLESTTFFLCGPGAMNKQLSKELYLQGVRRDQVFVEHFRMLDK